jgi:hypothetical protein
MKKLLVASLLVLLALGLFAGTAAAAPLAKEQVGPIHEYMEEALAEKLNLPLATVESEFDSGKTLAQIALDHGIAQADLPAFMQAVRALALQNAVADGVITQAQADRMLQRGMGGFGYGMMNGSGGTGYGMMNGGTGYGMMGTGTGPCGGTGTPLGGGMMRRGGRGQQSQP